MPQNTDLIRYKAYMTGLLRRLQSERAIISVKLDNHPELYNSAIIDIDPVTQEFFLDELAPDAANSLITTATCMEMNGRLKGVNIRCQLQVKEIQNDGSFALYRVAYPDVLLYRQRRRHYRARLEQRQDLPIVLPMTLQKNITGHLVDISISGVCSYVEYQAAQQLAEAHAIRNASIMLPGQNQVTCDLEVRSIRDYPEQGYSLVGSKFLDIDPMHQQSIERFVAKVDRAQRRSHNP